MAAVNRKSPSAPTEPEATPEAPERKARKPRTEVPALDMGLMEVAEVTDPEMMRANRRTKGERSQEQRQLDSFVTRAYDNWVAGGKPKDIWGGSFKGGIHLTVPDDQIDTLVYKLHQSAAYLGRSLRRGKTVSSGGRSSIIIVAIDRAKRQKKADEDGPAAE